MDSGDFSYRFASTHHVRTPNTRSTPHKLALAYPHTRRENPGRDSGTKLLCSAIQRQSVFFLCLFWCVLVQNETLNGSSWELLDFHSFAEVVIWLAYAHGKEAVEGGSCPRTQATNAHSSETCKFSWVLAVFARFL